MLQINKHAVIKNHTSRIVKIDCILIMLIAEAVDQSPDGRLVSVIFQKLTRVTRRIALNYEKAFWHYTHSQNMYCN